MEQYGTQNKALNAILEPFLIQLQNSTFDVNSKDFQALESKIKLGIPKNVFKGENDPTSIFFQTYKQLRVSVKPSPILIRQLVIQLSEVLSKVDDCKVSDIICCINLCETQIESLENTLNVPYVKKWFSDFCKNICLCISKLYKRSQEIVVNSSQNFIVIHIIQLSTLLQLLLKLFSQELSDKILIIESRRYIIKKFKYFFDEIKQILKYGSEEDNTQSNFIFWMDKALDLVGLIEPSSDLKKNVTNVKPAIDEVLCHAMSTAQICNVDDSKAIKAGIQSVLHEFNQLESESKKTKLNPSLVNLHVDVVSDKLCLLERRVNTAVLKISLKAFSDFFEPLRILQTSCEAVDVSILSRNEADLDNLISDFDLHVDRIMQIGLFAIACTADKKILSKMRASLSNLEALECELVPALTTLYMEPSKIACLHASLFVSHWKSEVQKLRDSVFFIIDPLAFGQVVREEYKLILENIQNIMSNPDEIITKENIGNTTKNIEVLINVIKVSLPDMKLKDDTEVLKHLKNLQDVHNEVCSACAILFKQPDRKMSERVLKRLQILLTMIERLMKILSSDTDTETPKPKDIIEEKIQIDLTNIAEKGQKLLKDRSMLFRTPKKVGVTPKIIGGLSENVIKMGTIPKIGMGATPRTAKYSESRKLFCMTPRKYTGGTPRGTKQLQSRMLSVSFAKKISNLECDETDSNSNNSIDLQITDILEELTCLVDTIG